MIGLKRRWDAFKPVLAAEGPAAGSKKPVAYKSLYDTTTSIYKSQGYAGFWTGNMANIMRFFPTQLMSVQSLAHPPSTLARLTPSPARSSGT